MFTGLLIFVCIFKFEMIKRQGDYYICDSQISVQQQVTKEQEKERQFVSTGDIKERLDLIKQRINILKTQKQGQQVIYISIPRQEGHVQYNQEDYHINLQIPASLLLLQEKIQALEDKIAPNQIKKQKIEKNTTIVERIKKLQKKLEDMIKNKSVEIIANNIMQYGTNIQQKQENLKQMYLYQVFTKTQGLNEEMVIIEKYLQKLKKVQRVINAVIPLPKLIEDHNEILKKKEELSVKISKMFVSMKEEYVKLLSEIDAIEI